MSEPIPYNASGADAVCNASLAVELGEGAHDRQQQVGHGGVVAGEGDLLFDDTPLAVSSCTRRRSVEVVGQAVHGVHDQACDEDPCRILNPREPSRPARGGVAASERVPRLGSSGPKPGSVGMSSPVSADLRLLLVVGFLGFFVDFESSGVVEAGVVEKLPGDLGGLHHLEDERVEVVGKTGVEKVVFALPERRAGRAS